jgi:hypothetical protein
MYGQVQLHGNLNQGRSSLLQQQSRIRPMYIYSSPKTKEKRRSGGEYPRARRPSCAALPSNIPLLDREIGPFISMGCLQ